MGTLYPEQLHHIARLLAGLTEIDGSLAGLDESEASLRVQFRSGLPVEDYEGNLLGYAVDEVGGAWGFRIASEHEPAPAREIR